MARTGTGIFAATEAGIFISKDDGRTWAKDAGLTQNVSTVFDFKGQVFAATASALYRRNAQDGSWQLIRSDAQRYYDKVRVLGGVLDIGYIDQRWTSTDGGATWSQADISLAFANIRGLAASLNGDLFAFGNLGSRYLSKDGGRSWTLLPSEWGGGYWDVQTAFSSDGSRIFYNTRDGRIFRVPDGQLVFSTPIDKGMGFIAVIGKYLLVGYQGGVSRSADQGATFQTFSQGLGTGRMIELASGASVYARLVDGLYRSADSGRSWAKVLPGDDASQGLSVRGMEVFAAYGSRLYHSLDDGKTWTWVENSGPGFAGENTHLAITSAGLFLQCGDGSLWTSTDLGKDWSRTAPALGEYPAFSMHAIGDRICVALDTGIVVSADFGRTWKDPDSALPPFEITATLVNGNDIYAAGHGVYRSSDGGKTWSAMTAGLEANPYVTALAKSGDTLYAGVYQAGLFISVGGGPWKPSKPSGQGPINITALYAEPDRILAGNRDGTLMSYSPSAQSWTPGPDSLRHVAGFLEGASRLLAFTGDRGILASSDGGITWESARSGLSTQDVVSLIDFDGLKIGTARDGLYKYTSSGDWTRGDVQFPTQAVNALATDGSFLYAALGGGGLAIISKTGEATVVPLPGANAQVKSLVQENGVLYAAATTGLFSATLPGPATGWVWTRLDSGSDVTVAVSGQNLAVASGSRQGDRIVIHQSKDGGRSFPDSLSTPFVVNAMAYSGNGDLLFGTIRGLNIVRHGSHTEESMPVLPGSVYSVDVHGGIWAAAAESGTFLSKNGGVTWILADDSLKPAYALAYAGDTLYAGASGTLKAVYVADATVGIRRDARPVPPTAIRVFRSGSASGRIGYTLPVECVLSLTLATADGKSMRVFTEARQAAGSHTVQTAKGFRGRVRYFLEARRFGDGLAWVQSDWLGDP